MSLLARNIVAVLLGLAGGVVMIAIDRTLGGELGEITLVTCAFVGAWLSGLFVAPLFGRGGRSGVPLCILGAFLATVFGAALGAGVFVFSEGFPQTEFVNLLQFFATAIWMIMVMILTTVVAPLWVIMMVFVHAFAMRLRKAA